MEWLGLISSINSFLFMLSSRGILLKAFVIAIVKMLGKAKLHS